MGFDVSAVSYQEFIEYFFTSFRNEIGKVM